MDKESIVERIQEIRDSLHTMRSRLDDQGYIFRNPDGVLPGPHPDTESIIAKLENTVGNLPLVLSTFYRFIGSVDFLGHHPDWNGCEYPDPLVILPITSVEGELDEYMADEKSYIDAFGSFLFPIAPDSFHKENVSGGMWYCIPVPSSSEDPPLLYEPHKTTFLNYLAIAIQWGGFPGIEKAEKGHTWPINILGST